MSDFEGDFDDIGSGDSTSPSTEEQQDDTEPSNPSSESRTVPIGESNPVQYSGKRPYYGRNEVWGEFETFTMRVQMLLNEQHNITNTKKTGLHEAFMDVATDVVDPQDVADRLVELRGYDPDE
jgi:hypothetical protein